MNLFTPHQKAALNYKNHISLTANAGSGKTFVLSNRYLEILLNENVSIRNIAAITFTDKAASELYKKISLLIEERIRESQLETEKKKLENIRQQLVSANISTIHSFCINILKEHPVEANLDANFLPIDEQLSNELIELSVEEIIKSSLINNDKNERIKSLIRFFGSKHLLEREFIHLIKNRKNILKISETLYKKDCTEIALYFRKQFEDLFVKIFLPFEKIVIDNLRKINSIVLGKSPDNQIALKGAKLFQKFEEIETHIDKLKYFSQLNDLLFTKSGTLKKKDYIGKTFNEYQSEILKIEEFFSLLKEINFDDNAEKIEKELALLGKEIIFFFEKSLLLYEKKKKENGFLDYEDILLFTKNILQDNNVKESLSEKFKYIMVDEYQDTNETQYNIFLPILNELKKGNLFVVGDEKQSIYMFRDAELEIFNKTKEDISKEAGAQNLLTLPDSFRMSPAICLFANELFKNLFANHQPLFNEVEASDIICARNDEFQGKIEILISNSENDEENIVEENEPEENLTQDNSQAEMVAKRILQLIYGDKIKNKLSWKDIAILCRKRASFKLLEKAFIKFKIPFSILGGRGFYQRQFVYDILNYFSFLLDDKNDTALIGLLRSPFFLISDSEIFELSLEQGDTYWIKVQNYSLKNNKFFEIVNKLKENKKLSGKLDVTALLRKILNESNLVTSLAAKQNGKQEIANLNKLVKLTINFVSQGFKTLYDYVIFLRDSIEKAEDESQALLSEESDSVKVMTLHQAKGLEFPAVFLFKCEDKSENSVAKARTLVVNKELGILTKIPVGENYFKDYQAAPIVGLANIISKRKNAAEIKRLLYVGVTRAINYLFITASSKKVNRYNSDSFMGLISLGLGIDLERDLFRLNGELKFLIQKENNFENIQKKLSIEIPIIKNIEYPSEIKRQKDEYHKKELRLKKIEDRPKGEIISATKISIFNQCPVKYQLTYEYGFGPLFNEFKHWLFENRKINFYRDKFEYNEREDEVATKREEESTVISKTYADLKGRIIHKLLEQQILIDELEKKIEDLMKQNSSEFKQNEKNKTELIKEIKTDLNNYFGSKTYSEIKNFKNFKNEFEIYLKENDYFLYGIIDKIILNNQIAIIIDFKTDNIGKDEIGEKAKSYFVQLRFYAYLTWKLFKDLKEIDLRIVFIKYPDLIVTEKIQQNELDILSKNISSIIKTIRSGVYLKNSEHCTKCYFSLNGNCIKK